MTLHSGKFFTHVEHAKPTLTDIGYDIGKSGDELDIYNLDFSQYTRNSRRILNTTASRFSTKQSDQRNRYGPSFDTYKSKYSNNYNNGQGLNFDYISDSNFSGKSDTKDSKKRDNYFSDKLSKIPKTTLSTHHRSHYDAPSSQKQSALNTNAFDYQGNPSNYQTSKMNNNYEFRSKNDYNITTDYNAAISTTKTSTKNKSSAKSHQNESPEIFTSKQTPTTTTTSTSTTHQIPKAQNFTSSSTKAVPSQSAKLVSANPTSTITSTLANKASRSSSRKATAFDYSNPSAISNIDKIASSQATSSTKYNTNVASNIPGSSITSTATKSSKVSKMADFPSSTNTASSVRSSNLTSTNRVSTKTSKTETQFIAQGEITGHGAPSLNMPSKSSTRHTSTTSASVYTSEIAPPNLTQYVRPTVSKTSASDAVISQSKLPADAPIQIKNVTDMPIKPPSSLMSKRTSVRNQEFTHSVTQQNDINDVSIEAASQSMSFEVDPVPKKTRIDFPEPQTAPKPFQNINMNLNEEISQEEVQKVEEINELMKSFGADSDNDEFLLNNDGIDTRIDDKINHLLTDKLPNDRNKPIIRPEDLKKGIFSSDDLEEEEEEDKNEQKQNQQKFPNDIHNNLEIEENKEEVEDKNEKVKSVNSNDQKYEDIQLEFEKKFMKQLDKPKIESYLDGSDKSEDMIADESDISDYQECDIADDELLQMGSLRTGVKGDFDDYSEDEETDDYDGDWLANNIDEAFIPSKTHVQNQNDAKPENYLKLESKNEEEEYQYSDNEEIPLDPIKKLTINEDDLQSKNDSKLESKNIENSDVDTGDDEILKSEELRSIIRNYGLNDDEEEDGNNTEDLIRRLENIGASPKKSNDNEITLENAFNEEEEEASLIIKPDNKNETSNFDLDAKSTPLKNEIPINLDNDDEISDFLKNENNVNDITPNPPNSPRLEGENEEHIDPKREPKSELKSDIKKEPQNDELVDENSSDSDDASIDAIIKDASAKGYIQSDDEDEEEEEEELFIQENKTPTSRFKKQLKFIFNSIKIGSEMSNGGIDITNECAEKILRIQLKSVLGL